MNSGVLLDTCAAIWLMNGSVMTDDSLAVIINAAESELVHVSPFTAWEAAMLHATGRSPFSVPARDWYLALLDLQGVTQVALDAAILMAAWLLPLPLHRDPADRILIATARAHGLTLVTRDRAILAYGAAGHARVMAC